MTDFLGKKITVGARVVWPKQTGHFISMNVGTVKRVNDQSLFILDDNGDGRTVHRTDNVTVVR